MSMRMKAIVWIAAIMMGMTGVSYVLGLFFAQQGLTETMEKDLEFARDIADDFISAKVDLMKSDAWTVAERLNHAESIAETETTLTEQFALYPDFVAFTVFDKDGIIAKCGSPTTDPTLLGESKYLDAAFGGDTVISTTRLTTSDTGSKTLVFHICVPLNNTRVLSVSIPGQTFSDLLLSHKLWKTGHIFILDEEGTVIASKKRDSVQNRINFTKLGDDNENARELSRFATQAINTEQGNTRYIYNGEERFCSYKKLSNSSIGWILALVAPLPESPAAGIKWDLLLSTLLLLIIGVAIAIVSSNTVARPYQKIREQKQHLEELRQVAESASEAKSSFLANMSHEMRTPLNAIIGLSELTLGSERIDDESHQNVEKVYNAGMNLLGIVNDILDLSKIESGKFEIIEDDYDIPSLINDTAIVNMVRIGSKPIKFNIDPSPDLPNRMRGDELRLKQIFNNLLSNAFKYTENGSVDWRLYTERDEGGLWLVSEVKDSGIGIRPEDIKRLFENYNQVDTRSNRKIEGTGLGLSITKSLAQLMGGDIFVESEYGKGSTFTLRVRQGDVGSPPIGPKVSENLKSFDFTASKRARNEKLARVYIPYARVLVVDDVATNLDVARGILKPYGITVDCVTNGQAAIDVIRAGEPAYDAIFMDHMMPGMDGIEATRIIREEIGSDYAKSIPILALTANAIAGNDEMFLKAGFQAFLTKPIDIMVMDGAVRRWVRNKEKEEAWLEENGQTQGERRLGVERRSGVDRRKGGDRRASQGGGMAEPASKAPLFANAKIEGLDIELGIARFAGDEDIYMDVLRSYYENTPELLETLAGTDISDLPSYAVTVHGIKSSSRSIGAESVGSKAEALEKAAKAGNSDFVNAENGGFVEEARALLVEIGKFFDSYSDSPLQRKASPDAEALSKLLGACEAFDMDSADEAMDELEKYTYESGGELIGWLRKQLDVLDFNGMAERLRGATDQK
jgi:signal transduction histidine kinase/CheY-like chemotaxis protein